MRTDRKSPLKTHLQGVSLPQKKASIRSIRKHGRLSSCTHSSSVCNESVCDDPNGFFHQIVQITRELQRPYRRKNTHHVGHGAVDGDLVVVPVLVVVEVRHDSVERVPDHVDVDGRRRVVPVQTRAL